MGKLASFRRLSNADRLLLAEAGVLLALARLAVVFVPFATLARRLGQHMGETPDTQSSAALALSRRVQRAVRIAAQNLPWESVCLPQAIAAKLMLRRRGVASTLYLGVRPGPDMVAHAWVRVGDLVVTGDDGRERYTVVSTFA